jgi:hypothetical protein
MARPSFSFQFLITTLLKQKHEKRTNSGPVPVPAPLRAKDVFFLIKNVLFSGTNHELCLKK